MTIYTCSLTHTDYTDAGISSNVENMSSSASTSASSAGSRKRRFEKENKTILSSVLPEDESDDDYVDEESDDSEDDEVIDGEHEIIYIDDDEVDIPSLPGESKIDSAQVDAWARRLPGVAGPRLDRRTKGIRAIASIVLVSYSK